MNSGVKGSEKCPSAAKAAMILLNLTYGLKPVPFKTRVFPQPVPTGCHTGLLTRA